MSAELGFTALVKNNKKDMAGLPEYRLGLLGDCATQHLATALRGYAYTQGLALRVFDADYDQITVQTVDPGSELYAFEPHAVLIFRCVEKLYQAYTATPGEGRAGFADAVYAGIEADWAAIRRSRSVPILQMSFAELDDGVFGSYAWKVETSFPWQLRRLNTLLMEGARAAGDVFIVDLCAEQARMGREAFYDPKLYAVAKMPLSLRALPRVAARAVAVVQALRGGVKKCLVLDLDNTLWGGVIGDDGLNGIEIGELGTGHAFTEMQTFAKELGRRGVILAVCSKNEEETAREPFEKHSEMVLRLEDFAMFVANWEDNAANLRMIQETLNIGMDSIVFVDDNPFERDLVRSLIPEITVPELPEDPALYVDVLRGLDLFETASYSSGDKDRARQYRAEAESRALQQQYASYEDYLRDLEMRAEAKPFDAFHFPRIAQLTQRSNQFNLRTVRYTEAQVAALAGDGRYITLYFTLRDKLADHGLISVVVLEKREDATLFVDTWLMSCRVLKRGMEEYVVNAMMAAAKAAGYVKVVGEYLPTPKNKMVQDLYARMGFTPVGGGRYEAAAADFRPFKTYIAPAGE